MKRVAFFVLIFSCSTLAWAGTPREKLDDGFINMVTGPQEILKSVDEQTRATDWFEGWTTGFARGVGRAIARTGSGVYEMLTFLIPVPPDHEPLMEPLGSGN